MSKNSISNKILCAGVLITLAHLLLKFSGLILTRIATHYLEPTVYESIVVVAWGGVLNSIFYIGQELLTPTFLSVFMAEKESGGDEAAWRFANVTLSTQSLLLLAVILSIVCFPDGYIRCFTSWTQANQPLAYPLLRTSLQILAPCVLFLSLGSTTYVILNGYKEFFLAAFGDSSTKICVILGLLLGIGVFGWDYHALLLGLWVGSVAKLVTHLIGLGKRCCYLRFSLNMKHPAFISLITLMLPLIFGVLFAKVRDNFNNIYVLSRLSSSGALMANDLGRRLYAAVQWLVPYSLQIALFPFLCELASRDDREQLGKVLGKSCRWLVAIFLPCAAVLSVLSTPLGILIFSGGKASLTLATWAGLSMGWYCLVLPATAVESVLLQGMFANRQTVASTVIGVVASMVSMIISYYFVVSRHSSPQVALSAVALGFVVSRYLKSLALAVYVQRSVPLLRGVETWQFLLKILAVTVITWCAAYGCHRGLNSHMPISSNRWMLLVRLAIVGGVAVATYGVSALLLKVEEIRWAFQRGVERLRRKRGNGF